MLTSPLVTHIPHSSIEVPLDIRDQFVLNDDELDLEIKKITEIFWDLSWTRKFHW